MTNESRSFNTTQLSLYLAGFLISFSPVFVKIAHVGPTMAGVYRTLFAGIILTTVAIYKKEPLQCDWRKYLFAVLIGFIFAVDLTAWHKSIHYIGPGLAALLCNFQVFILSGFGVLFLKERLTLRFKIAVPLALTGLVLIFGWDWNHFSPQYKLGFVLGLVTAFTYAGYTISIRHSQTKPDSLSPLINLIIASFSTSFFMTIFSLLQGESFVIPDLPSWASLISLGFLCHAGAWMIFSKYLPKVNASSAGLILLLQPALAFIWDMILFKRPTTIWEIGGAALTLAAIYLGAVTKSDKIASSATT